MKIPRPPRTVAVALATVIAVVLPMIGLSGAYAYAGDVPRGTTVLGVDLGGMSRDEATGTLQSALDERADALAEPIEVQVGSSRAQLDPAAVGLAVDVEATVEQAASRSFNPLALFAGAFGEQEVDPVVTVDSEQLDDELRELVGDVGEAMTLPAIRYEGTEPVPVYPEPGLGLDREVASEIITDAWPHSADPTGSWLGPEVVHIPLVDIDPVSTAEDVDRLLTELAYPAVAGPVTVTTEEGDLQLSPDQIAASLTMEADTRGEIKPEVDPEALREALSEQLKEVERKPKDAEFVLSGGAPSIVDDQDGLSVDTETLAEDLLQVLPQSQDRELTAELVTEPAELSADDLEELGVKEQVSTFTTDFPGDPNSPRNQNIKILADQVDGALVQPGEVFSLNEFSGPRGYEQGYKDAAVIIEGRLQPAVGGGLSQFTTTLFNASFYAGLEDVEHTPHSYYYSRYPAVIEATIFYPSLDMKFRNNTDHGIVIDTSYNDSGITVTMWGTKVWDDVTAEWGDRRDATSPKRQYVDPGPSCIDTEGIPGFTQDAWRVFHQDGQEVKREKFTWRYDAQPEVICAEDPDEDDD